MPVERVHQPMDADLDAVGGPGDRHGIEHTDWQRIAHRADAGRFTVRPGFEADIEDDGDALAVRPSPRRLPIRLLLHSRPQKAHIAPIGRKLNHTRVYL